jgi:hypothetical protein
MVAMMLKLKNISKRINNSVDRTIGGIVSLSIGCVVVSLVYFCFAKEIVKDFKKNNNLI